MLCLSGLAVFGSCCPLATDLGVFRTSEEISIPDEYFIFLRGVLSGLAGFGVGSGSPACSSVACTSPSAVVSSVMDAFGPAVVEDPDATADRVRREGEGSRAGSSTDLSSRRQSASVERKWAGETLQAFCALFSDKSLLCTLVSVLRAWTAI